MNYRSYIGSYNTEKSLFSLRNTKYMRYRLYRENCQGEKSRTKCKSYKSFADKRITPMYCLEEEDLLCASKKVESD